MDKQFKNLADKLEQSSAGELLPDFDKVALWTELSPRLQKKQRRAINWGTYAAAAVLVIVLGGALLKWMNTDTSDTVLQVTKVAEPTTTGIVIPEPAKPANILQQPTVPASVAVHKPAQAVARMKKETNEIPQLPVQQGMERSVPDVPATEIATVPATVVPVRKKARAVHLLDIENEDRQLVIKDAEAAPTLGDRVAQYLSTHGTPDKENEHIPASGLKSLLKK